MNWEAIGAIGEIAGALAVVITLLFLSKQVREASKQIAVSSAHDANTLYSDAFWPIYNNEHNLHIWVRGHKDPSQLSEEEFEVYKLFMTRLMAVYDSVVEYHDQGVLSEERFQTYTTFTIQFLETPGGIAWSQSGQYHFNSSAQRVLDQKRSE